MLTCVSSVFSVESREELGEYKVQVVAEQGRVSGLVSQTSSNLNATANQISEAEAAALAYEQQLKEQEAELSALRAKLAEEIRLEEEPTATCPL